MGEGMKQHTDVQLSALVDHGDVKAVIKTVREIFSFHYPRYAFRDIEKSFSFVVSLFRGKVRGYRACNTEYHNLTHTVDAALASARLLDGYNQAHEVLPEHIARNLLKAALLHDSGYIQEVWDTEGSGAKYTSGHVERSVDFLEKNHRMLNIESGEVGMVARIIRCTGLSALPESLNFTSDGEAVAGCIMGTADLLGQMSDRAYLEKLLFLYHEFREAGIPGLETEFDILKKTVAFYAQTVRRRRESYRGVNGLVCYHFRRRFGVDRDLYEEAISRHMAYLQKILDDSSTNFRHKLKRGSWVHDEKYSRRR
jgi:hypothetical protein